MKNMKKWLPILLIALVTMFLTGCKVDWTTVSATVDFANAKSHKKRKIVRFSESV